MAQGAEKLYKSFVQGLITEASALTFPENASIDESNFVLNRDGSRSRRLGVDYEANHAMKATGISAALLESGRQSFHKWDFPDGNLDLTLGVVRINNKLFFMDLHTANPSNNFKNGGSSLTLSGLGTAEIETTVVNHKLIIVSSDLDKPVLLSYNTTADSVSQEEIDIKVRDIWGVNDNLDVGERPTTLSTEHNYNLINQGWNDRIVTSSGNTAIQQLFDDKGFFPANSDIASLGKEEDVTSTDFQRFDSTAFERASTDIGFVTKGAIILDAFNRGASRQTESGLTGLPADQETGNISTCASYAGRVFYSGINSKVTDKDDRSPYFSGYVFFSQTITGDDKFGSCFQEADPTSDEISDIIDTDGGTIQIPECSQILKIIPANASLLVFSDNGVWEIFGDTGGFLATEFQVSKISSNGINNPKSVVELNGAIAYWSRAGIYTLTADAVSTRYRAENISLTSIQSYYLAISDLGKKHCRGIYDEKENRVRWLFNDTNTYSETSFTNKYNKELILDLTLKAFYPHEFSFLDSNSPFVADYIQLPDFSTVETTSNVQIASGSDNVVVGAGADQVVVSTEVVSSRSTEVTFLTMQTTNFTVSKYKDTTFVDWKTQGSGTGKDYSSFLSTGFELFGDAFRRKEVPYIWFYFTRTEDGFSDAGGSDLTLDNPSSCKVKAQWDFADSANSGKIGTQFQAYRLNRLYIPASASDTFDYGKSTVVTKNKLRGSGRALSLLIESEAGKDMKILGWGVKAAVQDIG